MPSVSVIIPTYNRAHTIERAVTSVLGQRFRDFELIVVDDGSTDGTVQLDILKPRSHPLLRLVRFEKNGGVSRARNAGVRESTGIWIAFLDSDDEWRRDKLSAQVAWTEQHPEFRIVQTREVWIRNGTRVNPPLTHEKKHGWIFEQSLQRCMVTPSSVLMQRTLFDEAGGFNESLPVCEDYDLWLRITCSCPVGLVDRLLLTRYGGHGDQLSRSVEAIDRFRVQSMQNLLNSDRLTPEQRLLTRRMLARKAGFVAEGARKRGNLEVYEIYRGIADQSV